MARFCDWWADALALSRGITICGLALGLALLFTTGCSGPNMTLLDRPVGETRTTRALTKSTALKKTNRRTLKEEGLLRSYNRDPHEAIGVLAQRYQAERTEARRRALAEMTSDTADRLAEENPAAAIGHYLETVLLTKDHISADSASTGDSEDRVLHSYATVRVVRILHANPDLDGRTVKAPGATGTYELELAKGREFVSPWQDDLLVPADWLKFKGMNFEPVVQEGIGEAMVGHRNATAKARTADPLMPNFGHSSSLNASLRFSGMTATLCLQDLMRKGRAELDGRTVPLKGDFTAALAFLYDDDRARGQKFVATLRPWKHREVTGLYSLEPFREDKIPLIVVHGLLSSGGSFFPLANNLRADPVVRERYQLMFFSYPTGIPIAYTAAELRGALAAYYKLYDPGGRNRALDQAVLIGHSMGGLLSNIQIRSSGDQVEKRLLKQRLEDLEVDEASRQRMAKLLRFEANPHIKRVVFIAVPHRGSAVAANAVGKMGSLLIRQHFDIGQDIFGSVLQPNDLTEEGGILTLKNVNGINSLDPKNPNLQTVLELPVRKDLVMHSIIAQKDPDQALEESSDGVVTYRSAHLEEAATEKIIPGADHKGVVEDSRCVQELFRILREHAGS